MTRPVAEDDGGRLVKHSLVVAGHRTSVSLETLFWQALRREAARRDLSLAALVREVDAARGTANLSSALRVFVLRTVLENEPLPSHDTGMT